MFGAGCIAAVAVFGVVVVAPFTWVELSVAAHDGEHALGARWATVVEGFYYARAVAAVASVAVAVVAGLAGIHDAVAAGGTGVVIHVALASVRVTRRRF